MNVRLAMNPIDLIRRRRRSEGGPTVAMENFTFDGKSGGGRRQPDDIVCACGAC